VPAQTLAAAAQPLQAKEAMRTRPVLTQLLSLGYLFLLIGCGNKSSPPLGPLQSGGDPGVTASGATLTSITVTPASALIAVGASQNYTAVGTYSDGSSQTLSTGVTWAASGNKSAFSSVNTVVDISSVGVATGIYDGTTTITANVGNVSSSGVNLTINPSDPTNFQAQSVSSSKISLSWTKVPGVFEIQYYAYVLIMVNGSVPPSNCDNFIISDYVTTPSFTESGLSPNQTYSFILCSQDSQTGLLSAGVTATVTTGP
jgi:hypothetical protein